jgi:hypothetical protein
MIRKDSIVSYEQILDDILKYVESLPDYASFKDLYEPGVGYTLIEAMSAIGALWSFRIGNVRREVYLGTARLQTSIYLIAKALGYNPRRKKAPQLRAFVSVPAPTYFSKKDKIANIGSFALYLKNGQVIPTTLRTVVTDDTGVQLVKKDGTTPAKILSSEPVFVNAVAGQRVVITNATTALNNDTYVISNWISAYEVEIDSDFYTSEFFADNTEMVIPKGIAMDVIVGLWEEIQLTVTDAPLFYKWNPGLIDYANDIEFSTLEVFDQELELVHEYHEVKDDGQVLLLSEYNGDVQLVFGDGIFGYKVKPSDLLTFSSFNVPGFMANLASGTENISAVTGVEEILTVRQEDIYTRGSDEESLRKIAYYAPLYHQSFYRAVTEIDEQTIAAKYFGMKDASSKVDESLPVTIRVSYLKEGVTAEDPMLMNDFEKQEFLNYLTPYRMAGTQYIIEDPQQIQVDFKMTIVIEDSADTSYITEKVNEIIDLATQQLGKTLFVAMLYKYWIVDIENVVRVYPIYPYEDRTPEYNQYYQRRNVDITFTTNKNLELTWDTNQGEGYVSA